MKSQIVGYQIIKLLTVDSTNNYVAKLVNKSKVSFGTVIMADFQTKGKGQRDNLWHSDNGKNLLFSIYFDSSFLTTNTIFYLSKIIAISLRNFIFNISGKNVKIKWPNDIIINHQKIAGILIENQLKNNNIHSSIIGIGLNVNQINFIKNLSATSLRVLTHREYDLKSLLEIFINVFNSNLSTLKEKNFNYIDNQYHQHLLNFNKWALYKENNSVFKAKLSSVNEQGFLDLVLENGKTKSYDFQQIKQLI
ncbi:MAG: biotin--[acetyl-CoA-carboxylase] ligase [Crocinitomicaceae bacterium]|nr:biotin--[acetyl-CoA-carboxylase] ligase [Crocinitomicaceae bacterium]